MSPSGTEFCDLRTSRYTGLLRKLRVPVYHTNSGRIDRTLWKLCICHPGPGASGRYQMKRENASHPELFKCARVTKRG